MSAFDGPREEDGDYARDFFDAYERAADALQRTPTEGRREGEVAPALGHASRAGRTAGVRLTGPLSPRLAEEGSGRNDVAAAGPRPT